MPLKLTTTIAIIAITFIVLMIIEKLKPNVGIAILSTLIGCSFLGGFIYFIQLVIGWVS